MNALPPRKATNLSLDAALVDAARALDVNLSRAAEEGLRKAVAASSMGDFYAAVAEATVTREGAAA